MTVDGAADAIIIGAGVVGLASARALARQGRDVIILERHARFGEETSSRNSEVIHAGLYYPTGSLKARACVEGRKRLYAYCEENGIGFRRCGKLVVATGEAEHRALEHVQTQAHANGNPEIGLIDGAEARRLEPHLHCLSALDSPQSGLVDSHALMLQLLADAEAAGATLACRSTFVGAAPREGGFVAEVEDQASGRILRLACALLVNAGGLGAIPAAQRIRGLAPHHVPKAYFSRGCYFQLRGPPPFTRLIYPVPGPASLGIHYTLDQSGRGRFGPDHEWIAAPSYTVDPARARGFYASIRRYFPTLPDGALAPDYAGVRPKIQAPGEPARDFLVEGPAHHGLPGLINLFGIESPGLTSSLYLGDLVATLGADASAPRGAMEA